MMDHRNRKLQPSIRPLRSEYRVYRSETGRTIFVPHNEMEGSDYVEFCCNVATSFLLTYWIWLGIVHVVPFFNTLWPAFGMTWIGLCWVFNDSWARWPVRFIVWGIFWGMLALS
jgi:hypothetical protein